MTKFTDIIIKDNYGTEYYPVIKPNSRYSNEPIISFDVVNSTYAGTPPWPLRSIMSNKHNKLFIDMGQNWYLIGMIEMREKLKTHENFTY